MGLESQVQNLTAQNHQLTDTVTALTQEVNQLRAECARLANVQMLLEAAEAEKMRLSQAVAQLTHDLQACQAECSRLIALVSEYETKLGVATTENQRLGNVVHDNQVVINNLTHVEHENVRHHSQQLDALRVSAHDKDIQTG